MKPLLFVDVDATIADPLRIILNLYSAETGKPVFYSQIKDYYGLKAIGGYDNFIRLYKIAWQKYWKMIPMTEADIPDILDELNKIYDIVYVTQRPQETVKPLHKWLDYYAFPKGNIWIAGARERITEAWKKNAILVDDYPYVSPDAKRRFSAFNQIVYDLLNYTSFVKWFNTKLYTYTRPWNLGTFTWSGWKELLPGHPSFPYVMDELLMLHARKNSDYAFHNPLGNLLEAEQMGLPAWIGVAIRLGDKMSRLRSLAYKTMKGLEAAVKSETIEDIFKDMAVYSILGLIVYREEGERNED